MALDKFYPLVIKTVAPYRGPTSSEDYNDALDGIVGDLTTLQELLNNHLQPIIDTLPGGKTTISDETRVDYPDALANGLDGDNIYIDNNQTSTDVNADLFYNTDNTRPKTIKETIKDLFTNLNSQLETLRRQLEEVSLQTTIIDIQDDITSLTERISALEGS